MKIINKIFGGINLTWPKLIILSVIMGVYTAVMAIVPALHYTSFITITATFEVWILFGIFIIMNSKSNLDSALKCFVFFLISQPLVYLIQVPFASMGWDLFQYYKYWFGWTVLCFPMGFIGYWMKKDKWWGYLILLPMILLTAYEYFDYFSVCLFYRNRYIIISLFCIGAMILYPIAVFTNKKIRMTGVIISCVLILGLTVFNIINPPIYSTDILGASTENQLNDNYKVSLSDDSYGDVKIRYDEGLEDYLVHVDFKKAGKTQFILESPDGKKKVYDLNIKRDTYTISEVK